MTQPAEQVSLDPAAKKAVLRMVTYGLYAVGVAAGEDRNLFTANWLTQVSFEPPLVALSVENDSHSIGLLRESGVFAVSIFGDDQREEAGLLGKRWKLRPDKIEAVRYRLGVTGCPILSDGLGAFECRVVNSMEAGDSTLFLAGVIHAEVQREGTPLTMQEAGFRHAG
jgi:flavin reductase (DIM6/NTAB) family NADH-FMN oxidoreductase RutF